MRALVASALLLAAAASAVAQQQPGDRTFRGSSLYEKDRDLYDPHPDGLDATNQSIYSDIRPRPRDFKKHDLVSVQVLERGRSRASATSIVNRQTSLEVDLDEFIRLQRQGNHNNNPFDNYVLETAAGNQPGIDFESEYERRNRGQTTKDGEILEKITAEVVEILPNRTLVIEARKTRQINDEEETIILTGVIRADDISPDNVVTSDRIARLNVEYTGSGSVNDAQKAGWLSRVWEWLAPF